MYKNKKERFENFWLQSAEANLKFVTPSRGFLLNNNRDYLQHNVWLARREVIDRVLQRWCEQRALITWSPPESFAKFLIELFDYYKKFFKKAVRERGKKKPLSIYGDEQHSSADIMCALKRINARAKARREKAGILNSYAKIELSDEAVEIALRAALKNRK